MDLNRLFKLFIDKGLYHTEVKTNNIGYFRAFSSTGYNGRGQAIEVTIFDLNSNQSKIEVRLMDRQSEPIESTLYDFESAFDLMDTFKTKKD